MAKTAAERQKEFRERNKGKTRKLEVLLPSDEFALLHDNAKQQGLTKAKYVVSLLHGNGDNQAQPNAIDLIEKNNKLVKENNRLTKQANEEHISKKVLESNHGKQLNNLNGIIHKLGKDPLKESNDELKVELAAAKSENADLIKKVKELGGIFVRNDKAKKNTPRAIKKASKDSLVLICANENCGKAFIASRKTARFCSDNCRKAAHSRKKYNAQ